MFCVFYQRIHKSGLEYGCEGACENMNSRDIDLTRLVHLNNAMRKIKSSLILRKVLIYRNKQINLFFCSLFFPRLNCKSYKIVLQGKNKTLIKLSLKDF